MELPVLNTPNPSEKGGCSASSCGSTETQVNPLPDSIREKVQNHPCYSEDAHHYFARMHVAVAPACNIQCHYCNRKYDCVNESRPGVTSNLLSPGQAAYYVSQLVDMGKTVDPTHTLFLFQGPIRILILA